MIGNLIRTSGSVYHKHMVNTQEAENYTTLDDRNAKIYVLPNNHIYTENFNYFLKDKIPPDAEVTFNTDVSIDDIYQDQANFLFINGLINDVLYFTDNNRRKRIELKIPYEKKLNVSFNVLPEARIISSVSNCYHVGNYHSVIIITVMIDLKFI